MHRRWNGQTRQTLVYVVSVGSILNQSSLFRFSHYSSDLTEIKLFPCSMLAPVNVFAMLKLSRTDPSFALGCFRRGKRGSEKHHRKVSAWSMRTTLHRCIAGS